MSQNNPPLQTQPEEEPISETDNDRNKGWKMCTRKYQRKSDGDNQSNTNMDHKGDDESVATTVKDNTIPKVIMTDISGKTQKFLRLTIKPQSDDENDNVLNAASHIMTTIHTKFVGPDFDLYDNNGKKKNTSRWTNAVEFNKQYQLYYEGGHGKDK